MNVKYRPLRPRVWAVVAFGWLLGLLAPAAAQNVGIGTATPVSQLHVNVGTADATGLLVTGTSDASGTVPNLGATTALMWFPRKSAFRAGTTTGTQWDNANVGRFSAAMGFSTTASGVYSFAAGYQATASNTTSVALGFQPQALGNYSVALGIGVVAPSGHEIALGSYNTLYAPNSDVGWHNSDRLLSIGNGSSAGFRSDALVVMKNGNVGIGTSTPLARLHVTGSLRVGAYTLPAIDGTAGQVLRTNGAGTVSWGGVATNLQEAYLGGSTITTNGTQGPVVITGNQGLLVHSPATGVTSFSPAAYPGPNYLFYSSAAGALRVGQRGGGVAWDAANIGAGSFANGLANRSSGSNSAAMGSNNSVSGANSLAVGSQNSVPGENAVAFGQQSFAAGANAFAYGYSCSASANSSMAGGYQSYATGASSLAIGYSAIASSPMSAAIGWRARADSMYGFCIGLDAISSGDSAIAIGTLCTASGAQSVALGHSVNISRNRAVGIGSNIGSGGDESYLFGSSISAQSFREVVIGHFNAIGSPATANSWVATDRLFVLGNGTAAASRSNAIVVLKNGNTGIGVNAPTFRLDLPNTASAAGQGRANAWVVYSDARVKTNLRALPYGLGTVMALKPLQYEHHNSTFEEGRLVLDAATPAATRIGFVAQELAGLVPEAATPPQNEATDLWAVDYTALVPVLVRALQEQQGHIDQLRGLVQQQALRLQAAEARLGLSPTP